MSEALSLAFLTLSLAFLTLSLAFLTFFSNFFKDLFYPFDFILVHQYHMEM